MKLARTANDTIPQHRHEMQQHSFSFTYHEKVVISVQKLIARVFVSSIKEKKREENKQQKKTPGG